MARLFRSALFIGSLLVFLASTSVALGSWALISSAKVATLTASAASTAARHRRELSRTKAKGRLRRYVVAVPVLGTAAAGAFDYREWQEDNPEGRARDYACEVYDSSVAVVDEVLQELPERVRPSEDWVLGLLPECGAEGVVEE